MNNKDKTIKIMIEEVAVFKFAYRENAERVAIALTTSGYFTRVLRCSEIDFTGHVYK